MKFKLMLGDSLLRMRDLEDESIDSIDNNEEYLMIARQRIRHAQQMRRTNGKG